jgi:hypothetical protein
VSRATVRRFGVVAALAAGLAVPTSASAGVLDSLSGWWPMYEGSGQVVHDLSGKGNNGMLGTTPGVDANDPTWIRGFLFGSALRFDGNDIVRIKDSPALDTHNVTVSAWVRASGTPGNYYYVIGKGGRGGCDAANYALYTGPDGGLAFYMQDATDFSVLHASGTIPAEQIWNGKWHHVAGTYDGTTAKLFVDGKLVPGSAVLSHDGSGPLITDDSAWGAFLGDCDLYYTGDLDDVAVFNQALPVDRIWSALSLVFSRPMR